MGVVSIWPQLPEPIRLLVFMCCFPASQHRCGGYAEAERLRKVLGEIRNEIENPGSVSDMVIEVRAILASVGK
jgi:hypothetical protein